MATYTVKKGDTLSAIAKQYGTTYQEIAKANGISDPNKIYAGQTLNIGGAAQTTAPKTTTPTTTTPAPTATPTASNSNNGFTYANYEKSDIVKQAEAMVQQQMANKPGEYQSNWQTQLNETIDKILNREEFTYDLNGDALYQQYKDQYQLQGKMGSMDVMGQAAAMNGGYGSSYGQTVGHQTYQGYLQQLNDRIPELYQLAISQYNQEGQDLKDQASLLGSLDEKDYGRYRDTVSDYYTELNRLTDEARYLGETEYNQYMDKTNMDYTMYQDKITNDNAAKSQASELALSMLSLGTMPSADLLASAGISNADAQTIMKAAQAQIAASASASANKSSGNASKQGGSEDSDLIRFTYSGTDDNGNSVFYRDGKKYTYERGTNPYTGTKNADAKNGTFSNGYQPNNVGTYKDKNGKTVVNTLTASGEKDYVNGIEQTVWKDKKGQLWIWDGTKNRYLKYEG